MSVDEHTIELAGSPVFYRRAPLTGSAAREPLYLHGIPTSSDDWTAFLERSGGVAPDLIGFGRTGKGGHLDYSLESFAAFVERFLGELEIERVDSWRTSGARPWGGVRAAPRIPPRPPCADRPRPAAEDFQWPPIVNHWRRPLLGELPMGAVPKWYAAKLLRQGGPWSDERIDAVWEQFDQGTQRAMLRLARATGEERLAAAGADLDQLDVPALIVWGERDPWLPATLADPYARRFRDATPARIPNAGHWPWLDDPTLLDRVITFLQQTDRQHQP